MALLKYLTVYNFDKKKRYGVQADGGYVTAELDTGYDCYISAGVSNEESFSRDFLNENVIKKEDCYAFDGTIENYPYEYTTNINFIRKNIGYGNSDAETNLSFLTDKYSDIFLKMDIEGGEYNWLKYTSCDMLQRFKQIVIEFHGILDVSWGQNAIDKLKCFEKLYETHYLIHAHGNNHAGVQETICDNSLYRVQLPEVIELTYVRRNYFGSIPELNTRCLPDPNVDFKNCNRDEIYLNYPPFVNTHQ